MLAVGGAISAADGDGDAPADARGEKRVNGSERRLGVVGGALPGELQEALECMDGTQGSSAAAPGIGMAALAAGRLLHCATGGAVGDCGGSCSS